MLRLMLRSKIHRVVVTDASIDYEGSLTVDEVLLKAAGIQPYEQVMVSNLNNGERFETYVIAGPAHSGTICLNGPTARKGIIGDRIVIFCYELYSDEELARYQPIIVQVDEKNRLKS